jgi:hypothetical protein
MTDEVSKIATDVKAAVASTVKADEAQALTFLQANTGKVALAVFVVGAVIGHIL